MATMDQTPDDEPVYEVPAGRKRTVSIERGGRFGLTLTSEEFHEDAGDHLTMLGLGLILTAIGAYGLATGAGTAAAAGFITFGSMTAGIALERYRYTRNGPVNGR